MLYKNPYISRVIITNFRNFLKVDVEVGHKQVIIGENNVGKTNFLRAIQLILDRTLSDNDRQLEDSDFHDSHKNPMQSGVEIEISLFIKGYEHNSKLMAQFTDAVTETSPPTLLLRYKFFPLLDEKGEIVEYTFGIFKGHSDDKPFTSEDRSYLNIYVIKALRDVERELKSGKSSPLYKAIKNLEINKEDLEGIVKSMNEAANELYELDELVYVREGLQLRFDTLSGLQRDNQLSLQTFDIDTERLLYSLQVYMGIKARPISELSLGLSNILYVAIFLIYLRDRTIPPILKEEAYKETLKEDKDGVVSRAYERSARGNYVIKRTLSPAARNALYDFMDDRNYKHQPFTILAIEEPEAHLHPVLQRVIYREVLQRSPASAIFSSHSTYISAVAPLTSIVHIRSEKGASTVSSSVDVKFTDKEVKDLERYIDAKRGELYFGKGVILVEGITEEYLVPTVARLLKTPLDDFGIVVCNVNSTNFTPYVQLLDSLRIPCIVITDGDFYEVKQEKDSGGKLKDVKVFHVMDSGAGNYQGNQRTEDLLVSLKRINKSDTPAKIGEQDEFFRTHGFYIGRHTCEIDIMIEANDVKSDTLKNVYADLISGGDKMLSNFNDDLNSLDFWSALTKIESNIGKGRFAQRLASEIELDIIPEYIKSAIREFVKVVKKQR